MKKLFWSSKKKATQIKSLNKSEAEEMLHKLHQINTEMVDNTHTKPQELYCVILLEAEGKL